MDRIRSVSRRSGLRRSVAALVVAALAWSAPGCGSDSSTGPGGDDEGAELLGSWTVTSFVANGMDGIAAGMSMTITFAASSPRTDSALRRGVQGTLSFTVTNDQLDLCEGNTNCSDSNPFEVEDGTMFLERGTVDEVALSYTVAGGALTLAGSIDTVPVTISASRG